MNMTANVGATLQPIAVPDIVLKLELRDLNGMLASVACGVVSVAQWGGAMDISVFILKLRKNLSISLLKS